MSMSGSGVLVTSCGLTDHDFSLASELSTNTKSEWRVFTFLAIFVVLAASCLRILTLQRESVDGDELFSRRVAMANTETAFRLAKEDLVHPPLYYFVLKTLLPVTGTGANGIRLLSLVSGVASIVVVLLWGVAVPALKRPTLLAAALLAINPTHIFIASKPVRTRSTAWKFVSSSYGRFFWTSCGIGAHSGWSEPS